MNLTREQKRGWAKGLGLLGIAAIITGAAGAIEPQPLWLLIPILLFAGAGAWILARATD